MVKKIPQKVYTTAYWWKKELNFGDLLTPLMLRHFTETEPVHSGPNNPQVVLVGSVLDSIPSENYTGIGAGSGMLHCKTRVNLSNAHVLGLRGKLTEQNCSGIRQTDYVLGDPGLLSSELVYTERDKHQLGIVPHWTDKELFKKELAKSEKYGYATPILINPAQDPIEVIKLIGSCKKIVSSSLHGIIIADSFNLPRRTETFPAMFSSKYEGTKFKFEDYSSVINQPIEFGVLQEAPKVIIDTRKAELFDMFKELKGILHV